MGLAAHPVKNRLDFALSRHTSAPAWGFKGLWGRGWVLLRPESRWRAAVQTIALVDDDRNILTSVSLALEAEGYRINTYTDGVSALDGFKTTPPDLAILDIKMPRMDGMETLRRVRQKSDLPVIFLGGTGQGRAAPRLGQGWHRPEGSRQQGFGTGPITYGPRAAYLHLEKPASYAHRHRVSHLAGAREQARSGEKPQCFDGCSLRRSGVRRRPNHRQPRQTAAHKVQGKRRRVRYD